MDTIFNMLKLKFVTVFLNFPTQNIVQIEGNTSTTM